MQSTKRDQQIELKNMRVERWRESGLKMSHYCKEANIPISTFSAWARDGSVPKLNPSPNFKRVVMQPVTQLTEDKLAAIEFIMNDKMKIKLHSIPSPDVIIAITKALMSCN